MANTGEEEMLIRSDWGYGVALLVLTGCLYVALPTSMTAQTFGRAGTDKLSYSGTIGQYGSLEDARNRTDVIAEESISSTPLFLWTWNDPEMAREMMFATSGPLDNGYIQHFDQPDGVWQTVGYVQSASLSWGSGLTTYLINMSGTSSVDCCGDAMWGAGSSMPADILDPDGNPVGIDSNGQWIEYSAGIAVLTLVAASRRARPRAFMLKHRMALQEREN